MNDKGSAAISQRDKANSQADLGLAAARLGYFERALALDQKCPSTYSNLGNALQELGALEEAAVACRSALNLDPGNSVAAFSLYAKQAAVRILSV